MPATVRSICGRPKLPLKNSHVWPISIQMNVGTGRLQLVAVSGSKHALDDPLSWQALWTLIGSEMHVHVVVPPKLAFTRFFSYLQALGYWWYFPKSSHWAGLSTEACPINLTCQCRVTSCKTVLLFGPPSPWNLQPGEMGSSTSEFVPCRGAWWNTLTSYVGKP